MLRNPSLSLPVNTFAMPEDIRSLIAHINWQSVALMLMLLGAIIYVNSEHK